MELEAAKVIGAGIATLPLFGVGIGLGNLFSSMVESISRNPAAGDDLFKRTIIVFAFTESIALFALVVVFMILNK